MIRFIQAAILTLLLVPSAGKAQDFAAGLDAFLAGDFAPALREWTPLAKQGNADAEYYLGVLYANAYGVLQDNTEAVKWYRLAAKQGYALAQINLGTMYAAGQGVPQDFRKAYMWLYLSAANGQSEAVVESKIVGQQLSPAQIVEAQRRARVCLASNYQGCD